MIADLIAQLENNTSSFDTIEYSWTMQPFDDPTTNAPAIYVFHGDETSYPGNLDNCVSQESIVEVGVFIIGDHTTMDALKAEVRSALLGWQYSSAYTGLEHKKGTLQHITAKYVWWLDMFVTTTNLRGT